MTDTLRNDAPWPLASAGPPPSDPPPTGPGPDGLGDGGAEETVVRNSPWRALVLLAALVGLAFLGLPIFLMVLAILVSVFLHEMGHYLAAKKTGMKVTEYFIGFGPKLWSFQRGETEYGVKLIPAGAYVRIIGMNSLEEIDPEDEDRTYRQQSYWRRLVTVVAGPAMNLFIGFTLMIGLFMFAGRSDPAAWTVAETVDGGAAEAAGIEPGDDVVAVGGEEISDWESFARVVRSSAGETVDVVVVRDGAELVLPMTVGERLSASGAEALGGELYADDVIVGVDGSEVDSFAEFEARVEGMAGETVDVEISRRVLDGDVAVDQAFTVPAVVPTEMPDDAVVGFAGLAREPGASVRLGPVEAVGEGAQEFGRTTVEVVKGFGTVFSPSGITSYIDKVFSTPPTDNAEPTEPVAQSDVPPPVSAPAASSDDANRFVSILGIVQMGNAVAEESWVAFIGLVILMNIFLGFVNLIPLPPLDGGHAAVATYEAIRSRISGRRYHADMAKLLPVTYAVFMLFVFIGLSSLYLDVVDPLQMP